MSAGPRPRAQRRRDTEHRFTHDVDLWVASASPDGAPYLVPLSFDWDGTALLLATPAGSPTGRNLAATRTTRLALGRTRDVAVIEGDVEVLEIDALRQQQGDRFAARTGFDPRACHPVPLVPRHPAPHPGLARGERAARPRADVRRPLARLTRSGGAHGPASRTARSERRIEGRPVAAEGCTTMTLARSQASRQSVTRRSAAPSRAWRRSRSWAAWSRPGTFGVPQQHPRHTVTVGRTAPGPAVGTGAERRERFLTRCLPGRGFARPFRAAGAGR
ncbi:hypothetical protein GCM10010521_01580 [Streptomyces rameus]|uniref:Pyridoxamine 5'-phosphate oxidase N-terminal domain-containing protein n=1 Tax=Streptomyces rameus TaxID=68261 RepID=A0ABP6MME6_9ACTN